MEVFGEVAEVARLEGIEMHPVAGTVAIGKVAMNTRERSSPLALSLFLKHTLLLAVGLKFRRMRSSMLYALEAMDDPLQTKTITLSCGKLTTGVTVKPWTRILMLRNSSSPETYFQAAFRIQSPWTIENPDGASPNKEQIMKQECYVFDFAPDRALRQIADYYSCRMNVNESNPDKKVEEFISFLPVLAMTGVL